MLDRLLDIIVFIAAFYVISQLIRLRKRVAQLESEKSPLNFPAPEQVSGQGQILILGDALALGYGASSWENGLAGYFGEIAPVEAYGDHRNQTIHLVTLFHTRCIGKILSQEKYRLVIISAGLSEVTAPDFSQELFQRNLLGIAETIVPYAERIIFLDTVSFALQYAKKGSREEMLLNGVRRAFEAVASAFRSHVRSVEATFESPASIDTNKNAPNDLGYRDLYCSLYPAFRDVFAPP